MVHGSWLNAHGSWPRKIWRWVSQARALAPIFLGHEPWALRPRALNHEPWALSHEPWTMSPEPPTINNRLINELLNSKVSKFQQFRKSEVPRFQDSKIARFQGSQISSLHDSEVSKFRKSNGQLPKFQNAYFSKMILSGSEFQNNLVNWNSQMRGHRDPKNQKTWKSSLSGP